MAGEIPKLTWKRRLDRVLADPPGTPRQGFWETLERLPEMTRLRQYKRRMERSGREPVMNYLAIPEPGPVMGVPLGGLGSGTITRGWRGNFVRWQMRPGWYEWNTPSVDQFSLYIRRDGQPAQTTVLCPEEPADGSLAGWNWGITGGRSTYHALYPRAWTVYKEPDPELTLTCRQVSPFLPGNYEETTTPAGVFVWTIENTGTTDATVGLMFSFQNGTGGENDRAGGHHNSVFFARAEGGDVAGVLLHHVHRQNRPPEEGQAPGEENGFEDPLTFAIATQQGDGVEVSYRARFVTSSSAMDVWGDFADDGRLENIEDDRPSGQRTAIGAALAATVSVPAGGQKELVFALAWDMPVARFGLGTGWYRRYTRFYGRDGNAASKIARDAIVNYAQWEDAIEKWQSPVLEDPELPDWYKTALFNESYYLADGGAIWTDGRVDDESSGPMHLPEDPELGHFAYLEGHEYRMYNTYDVHFYASFALIQLWPRLQLSLQRDIARAIALEHEDEFTTIQTGEKAIRKVRGVVPHDVGAPSEDPWVLVNSYAYQDATRWKDLNPKFVLSVYRDYLATDDHAFLEEMWEPVNEALQYMDQFDLDEDGMIENEGFPDQTYDTWPAKGPSAYTGGLWIACLAAAATIAEELGKTEEAQEYRERRKRAQAVYEEDLWNGEYYLYDGSSSRSATTVMADQLAGQWFARACNLNSILPPGRAEAVLRRILELNVRQFEGGERGAVNGMRPDGLVDAGNLQSQEVWTGVTYALAACMIQEGLTDEGFETASGIYHSGYRDFGYWFQTPEAWNYVGEYRALGYMRPLAIWAMQWAWGRRRATLKLTKIQIEAKD